jgi:hypothetical protein
VLDLNGCINTVLEATPVQVTVGNPRPEINVAGTTLTSIQSYATYQWHEWQFNTQDVLIQGATSQSFEAPCNSWYFLQVTDAQFCRGYSDTFFIPCKSGIGFEELSEGNLNIFPNPSENVVEITFAEVLKGNTTIYLTDFVGKKLSLVSIGEKILNQKYVINISDVAAGAYLIWIENNGQRLARKISKR